MDVGAEVRGCWGGWVRVFGWVGGCGFLGVGAWVGGWVAGWIDVVAVCSLEAALS